MPQKKEISRRRFLKGTAGALAGAMGFPYIVPSAALGNAGGVAASNRITLGFIGMGWMGGGHLLGPFLRQPGTQALAVCDVDGQKRERAVKLVEDHYANYQPDGKYKGCRAYNDFHDLLARDDIDAVVIATPQHWHAICAVKAAQAGKDIYCEKPLAYSIAEGKAMVQAVRRYGRIFQTGSQQRSDRQFRFACELVRNGYIGELKEVKTNIAGTSVWCNLPAEPVPDYLDWDMWLGPAPWRPYNSKLFMLPNHAEKTDCWRSYREYSGGMMSDWGAHHFDIAQWGLGMDNSGPVEIIPPEKGQLWGMTYKYANGVPLISSPDANGILFTGTEGKVEVNRGYLRTWPKYLINQQIGANEIHLYESKEHHANWLECIRTRRKPIADVEIGYRSVTVCHLGILAIYLNRTLKWDPDQEDFVNDMQASRFLSRPMRSPWRI